MNITKELLNYLGIISISIKTTESDILCFLRKQTEQKWIIHTETELALKEDEIITIQINFRDSASAIFKSSIVKKDKEVLTILLPKENTDKKLQNTINEISLLEKNENKFGRRKEERIKLQKSDCKNFMIKSLEQELLLEKQIFPCAIIDVSIHGICIITQYSPFYTKQLENFRVKISFTDCTSSVVIQCHKVHARLTKTSNKNYITLSCQILEPIHFEWKKHVTTLLERGLSKLENNFNSL